MTQLEQTYEDMRTAMEAAGYRVTLEPSKAQKDYWPRAVIAFYLYECGWTNVRIGRLLHRDHSTITCMRQRVQAAIDLPAQYDDVNEIIDNFKTKYNELFKRDL